MALLKQLILRVHPLLGLIVAIGANIGVSLGAFDRLYTPHLLEQLEGLDGPAISATTWLGVTNTLVSFLSLLGAELVRDRATKEPANTEAARVLELCKERGLIIGKGGLFGNTLRIKPPMCITKTDVDFMADCMDEVLEIVESR